MCLPAPLALPGITNNNKSVEPFRMHRIEALEGP